MIKLTGFHVDNILYENEHTIVQQATNIQNNTSVVLKCAKRINLTPVRRVCFLKDYHISQTIQTDCVIVPINFFETSNALISVYPDTGCNSLNQSIRSRLFQIDEILRLFFLAADALAQIHSKKWIHMNLSLDHILYDSNAYKVFLIDWQSAVKLNGHSVLRPPFVYNNADIIAPELTGFTNDVVDERTDLYALGCIFYELFTNSPVFREKDSFRQIQSHIMCQPVPPNEGYDPYVPVVQHVPEAISQILIKLLAKNPSHRYDSANHLKCDLSKCLTGKSFISGIDLSKTMPTVIHTNAILYERKEEIERMHMIYNSFSQQTFDDGISTVLFISGAPGSGRSALCKTLVPHVFNKNGYWIYNTFSCTPDLPLGIFIRILSQLIKMMRERFPDELENQMKKLIYKGLICPPFLIELIPELIPLRNKLSGSTQTKSHTISARPFLLALLQMLGQKFQPMILCMENFQWADDESIMLLESLLSETRQSFFVVATCESEQSAAINKLITNCRTNGINIYSVEARNLSKSAVNQCIMDIFQCTADQAASLSEIIYEKTDGNPRAVRMAIDAMIIQKQVIIKDTNLTIHISPTDPVEAFWHSSFYPLKETEREILQRLSCIGQSWSMALACKITDLPALEMERIVQKAFKYGLIAPDRSQDKQYHADSKNDVWMFSDSQIQQLLYLDLSRSKQENIHQKIAQHMALSISNKVTKDALYIVANHIARTKNDDGLKIDQARTYISAGERALMSGLFLTAYHYFHKGILLLSEQDWNHHHQLFFDLYINAMIAANLACLDNEIPSIAEHLSKNISSDIEKLKFYDCLASIYFRQNQHEKVCKTVRKGLSLVGIQLYAPSIYRYWTIVSTGLKYRQCHKKSPEQKISDKDLKHQLTIHLMVRFIRSAQQSDPKTTTGVIAKAIHRMLRKSLTDDCAYLWIMFARFLSDRRGFSTIATHWAHMGMSIIDQSIDIDLQAEARLVYIWHIAYRNKSFNDHMTRIKAEIDRCLIRGFQTRAVQAVEYYLFLSLSSGKRLKNILSELHDIRLDARDIFEKNDIYAMYRQTVQNLISGITPPHILIGQSFNEQTAIEVFTSNNNIHKLFVLYIIKLMLSVWFRNHEKSVLLAQKCESLIYVSMGTPMLQVVNFYVVLAYTGAYNSAEKEEQKIWSKKIKYHVQELKKWSDQCAENASHRYYLALAEEANHLKGRGDIADYYDRAIALAKTNQFYHEEALSNELAGAYYAKKEKDTLARSYIMDAYKAYVKWGADRKVAEYARQEQILKADNIQQTSVWPTMKNLQSQKVSSISHMDNEDIWHVTQAFCVELNLEALLKSIIQTVLRYSGAHKGCLVLKKQHSWFIEAHLNMESQEISIMLSEPIENSQNICLPIAHKVIQSNSPVCLWDAGKQGEYQYDIYIRENLPRSLLCVPISYQDNTAGLLYLENKRLTGLFTTDRVKRIQIIASQAAIAIKNAQFFQTQEKTVQDRATDLNLTVHQLSSAVQDLEARSREMMLLNQFSDELHGCQTDISSYLVLQSFAQKLFPGDVGILWIGDQNAMKSVASWGNPMPETDVLEKKNCPCIQSKALLFIEDVESTPRCKSCGSANDRIYLCIPLKDQSGEMGVLHFQFGTASPRFFDDSFTRRLESRRILICRMIAHYALALANIRLREALKYESRHDPLTGLFNRRHMQKLLTSAYKKAMRDRNNLGIVMIDIDHFKSFNDTYGHDTGDAVLKHLGAYLMKKSSSTFQPCRYGGEEFLIMCPNLSADELFETAESVRKGIMNNIKVPYKDILLDVTASLGAALFPVHGNNMELIIQKADEALYISKENGRNQVHMIKEISENNLPI